MYPLAVRRLHPGVVGLHSYPALHELPGVKLGVFAASGVHEPTSHRGIGGQGAHPSNDGVPLAGVVGESLHGQVQIRTVEAGDHLTMLAQIQPLHTMSRRTGSAAVAVSATTLGWPSRWITWARRR